MIRDGTSWSKAAQETARAGRKKDIPGHVLATFRLRMSSSLATLSIIFLEVSSTTRTFHCRQHGRLSVRGQRSVLAKRSRDLQLQYGTEERGGCQGGCDLTSPWVIFLMVLTMTTAPSVVSGVFLASLKCNTLRTAEVAHRHVVPGL